MADPNIPKIEADALFYATMSCLPAVKQAYRYFHAQGKTEEDFDRCAAHALAQAVHHAVQLTAREVKDPVWPYALDGNAGASAPPPLAREAATEQPNTEKAHLAAPQTQAASDVKDEGDAARHDESKRATIEIRYELGGRFWHRDCVNHFGGVMRFERDDGKRSLIRCLHCGLAGYYPFGSVGDVVCEAEEVAAMSSPQQEQEKP